MMSTFEIEVEWEKSLSDSEIATFEILWKIDRDTNFRMSRRYFGDGLEPVVNEDIIREYEIHWKVKHVGKKYATIDRGKYFLVFYLK